MYEIVLKVLLTGYILYALCEFFGFLFKKDQTSVSRLHKIFEKDGGKKIQLFDNIVLAVMLLLVVLLFISGVEYVSFTTGLLIGMTIIMTYVHRFSDPLPKDISPKSPLTALKMLTYSIHTNPEKAWRELIFIALLFTWALYMLATQGFGLLK